ncbi:MAG TPA: putative metal-binding motif-containing protein, partial [Myxococcota bacterium]|nr:putative metal-binding motif-containing protein [Myxococcota bacterium]
CTGVTACMGAAGWTCTAAEPEAERCDGVDNDCDGTIDEEGAAGCVVRYRDGDGDGAGVTATGRCLCGPEGDLAVTIGGDCDDDDPDVSPLAFESCNGVDDDCDGVADQPGTPGCALYFADADGDGWGSDADVSCLCQPDLVHVLASGGDCNDASAAANPDRDEVCDGLDNDCDGITDEEGATGCFAHYRDADGDGAVDASDPRCLCGPVPPYTATTGDDCSDRTAAIGPQATELCNGFDDDCDGTIDEEGATGCLPTYVDADGDGYGAAGSARCLCAPDGQHVTRVGGDCDDDDDGVHPGVEEACNGVDDDCDGEVDEVLDGDPIATGCVSRFLDQDGDGFGDPAAAPRCTCGATGPTPYTADNADDCDDAVATTHPGASEACNGVDDDCDGTTDVGEFADLVGPGWAIDYQDDDGDGIANCVDPCPVFVDRAPPQNTT